MERPSFIDLSTGTSSTYSIYRLKKWLYYIVVPIVVILILGAWIYWPSSKKGTEPSSSPPTIVTEKYEVCKSLSCIETAQFMLNNMNKSVNPCDNFYQFACGNFKNKNTIPHGKINTDIYHIYEEIIRKQYQLILEKNEDDSDSKATKIAKRLYQTCVFNSESLPNDTFDKLTNLTVDQIKLIEKTLQKNLEYIKEKNCVDLVEMSHPMALSSLYYQTHDKIKSWNLAYEMTKKIRNCFTQNVLNKINWLDDPVSIKETLGWGSLALSEYPEFPKSLLNVSIVDQSYSSVTNIPTDYIGNINLINMHKVTTVLQKSNGEIYNNPSKIIGISGFYNQDEKISVLPGGILQGIYFDLERPEHLNYGAFGSVMASKMIHILDNTMASRYYKFDQSCFSEKLKEYEIKYKPEIDELKFARNNYLNNLGVWLIHKVYEEWKTNNNNNNIKHIIGLEEFTQDQQFWLSYANTMCSKNDNSNEYYMIKSLSNLPEFTKDFQCKNNTKMYSINNKCKLFA